MPTQSNILFFKDSRFFSNPLLELKPFKFSDEETKTKRLRIPIVVMGKYSHSQYGDVDFSQEVLDVIVSNFRDRVTGFEPPVFLGHPIDRDSAEAHPAVAFIDDIKQDGDVLWAEAEVVDDEAYAAIKSGKFRYSSAEIVREYESKFEKDKSFGPALVGLAITNRPFIPNMPKVEAHSEPTNCTESFTIKQFNLSNSNNTEEKVNTLEVHNMTNPAELKTEETKEQQIDLADKFLALVKQVEEATQKANLAEAKLKEMERQETLEKVESFNLSQTVKDEFKQLFTDGILDEAQSKSVLKALEKFSEENNSLLLTQHGKQDNEVESSTERKEVEAYADSPYKRIIETNLKLAEAKRNK